MPYREIVVTEDDGVCAESRRVRHYEDEGHDPHTCSVLAAHEMICTTDLARALQKRLNDGQTIQGSDGQCSELRRGEVMKALQSALA